MTRNTAAFGQTATADGAFCPTGALETFLWRKQEIDILLERLRGLSEDHFGASPDDIDWSHVGTLTLYRDRLRDLADAASGEGEYAQ